MFSEQEGTCIPVKIVIVGDCMCGKTSLIHSYIKSQFIDVYNPTGFDTYTETYEVSESYRIKMCLWDTSGDSGYDRVRPLSYSDADLIIICFSVGDPESADNVAKKWKPEVRENCHTQPMMLVGCQSDLRGDLDNIKKLSRTKQIACTYEQGLNLAKDIGALVYSETSSKSSRKSVVDVFEVAALSAAGNRHVNTSTSTQTFKRQKSFIRRKRFSGVNDAKVQLRKEAVKSCTVM